MSKICDELRDYCKKVLRYTIYYDKFCYFADLIDHEMVELPKDRDGKPIHPGDIEYLIASGDICEIYTIEIDSGGAYVTAMVGGGTDHADVKELAPCELTCTMPDSLERIADELEELSVDSMVSDTNLVSACAIDLAERIRKWLQRRLSDESISNAP